MANQIAMYFGHGVLESPRYRAIEERAIEWGCTIDFAIIEDFDWLFSHVHNVQEDGELFNLLFTIVANRAVQAPTVEVKYKGNTSEVPTLLFGDSFLTDKKTQEKIEITDEMLNQLGLEMEGYFGYEYIGAKILTQEESWMIGK